MKQPAPSSAAAKLAAAKKYLTDRDIPNRLRWSSGPTVLPRWLEERRNAQTTPR